jgi:predicted GNAT family acetyltransferase
MNPEIKHVSNKFYKTVDNLECLLEYEMHGEDTIEFYHTFTPIPLRGNGYAMQIIKEGMDYAAKNNFKVVPACSAVRTFIERNPEYKQYLK